MAVNRRPSFQSLWAMVVVMVSLITFHVSANSDFPEEALLPTQECPRGFNLDGNECFRVSIVDAVEDCPRDASLLNGVCVGSELCPGVLSCGPGFTLHENQCTKIEEVEPLVSCPNHYQFDGGCCKRVIHSDVLHICEDGFEVSPDGVCFRESRATANASCEHGYVPDRKGCVNYEEAEAISSCRKGFSLQEGICVLVSSRNADEVCNEEGFKLREGKGCVRVEVSDPTVVCNLGELSSNNKRCTEVVSEEVVSFCRYGFNLKEGKCIKVIEEEVQLKCRRGFVMNSERTECLREKLHVPELLCRNGFEMKFGRCEAQELIPSNFTCSAGENISVDRKTCVKCEKEDAQVDCPQGFVMNTAGRCSKAVYANSELACASGFELRGRFCVNFETAEAERVCRRGEEGEDGRCSEVLEAEVSLSCPRRHRMAEKGNCVVEIYEDPQVECSNDGVVMRNGMCRVEVITVPTTFCPRGYDVEVEGGEGGSTCSRVDRAEPLFRCLRGYRNVDGTCLPIRT